MSGGPASGASEAHVVSHGVSQPISDNSDTTISRAFIA
jgi:hypothetical protein